MTSSTELEHESFARRHRGGMLLERYGIDLYPHPFLGFHLPPDYRSDMLNTDAEGFRLSDSPYGLVDSAGWLAAGGGGIVLGNSAAVGLAASNDRNTPASHLAALTGKRWLNLGVCAAVSVQELIAALPFASAASAVAIIGGGPDLINHLGAINAAGVYGAISFERPMVELAEVPLFDLVTLASGRPVPNLDEVRRTRAPQGGWNTGEAEKRTEAAARSRLRDLAVLTRAVPDDTPVVFGLQPYASSRTRDLTPQEKARFDFDMPIFGILHNTYEKSWPIYSEMLEEGCAKLGVTFLNLSADRFEGDSFADNVHFNDSGNRQAARLFHQAFLQNS